MDELADACIGITCSVLCGLAVLCWRLQSVAQQVGEHGCTHCDGFIGSVLLFVADHLRFVGGACLLRDCRGYYHVDQAWKIPGSACQGTHLRSDQEIDGTSCENCTRHP